MLLSFPDSLSGLFCALLGVYLIFASSAINLHFFLGVFLHFITGADNILREWREAQEKQKGFLGSEYQDHDLVVALANGRPCETKVIENAFNRLKREQNFLMWFSIPCVTPSRHIS